MTHLTVHDTFNVFVCVAVQTDNEFCLVSHDGYIRAEITPFLVSTCVLQDRFG